MREYGPRYKAMATFIIRKDNQGYFYWVLRSDGNYEVVARSSESYASKQGAKDSIAWVRGNASSAGTDDQA